MKKLKYMLFFTLVATILPLEAATRKGADHLKHRIKPDQTRPIQNLCSTGPVWKNATALRATNHYFDKMQRAVHPGNTVLAQAAECGITIHDLQVAENGTIFFISGELGGVSQLKSVPVPAVPIQSAVQTAQEQRDLRLAQNWLETFSEDIKINQPSAELSLSRYENDFLGKRHLRFQQSFKRIPVWANELYVHIDAEDQVYAVNGRYAPTPTGIDPEAVTIDSTRALQLCRSFLAGLNLLRDIPPGMVKMLRFSEPTVKKTIWIDKQGVPHLVWQVDIYADVLNWFTVMVDAATGEVLQKYSNTMSEGSIDASGVDLSGATRSFRAYEKDGTFFMLSDINELNDDPDDLPDNPAGGLWVIDLRNTDPTEFSQYYHVTSFSSSSWADKSAVSAVYNFDLIYDYYKNTHGRRAIDNNASTIISVVNVTDDGRPMDNAFWNGSAVFWGNGYEYFFPLAGALDVAAHELTHGVTEYTANLIYQDQPGALNESMSDFFAAMVDRDDWLIGEDIVRPGMGNALRDIANPHSINAQTQMPKNMDEYYYTAEDYGGVHTNCGIPLYAAYLISTSIGREKAEKIYYRALSTYLTRQSQFIDARKAIEQSATDLYGSGSELDAVKNAFDAVKITDSSSGGITPHGAGDNEVLPTIGGNQWIVFVRDDLQIGLYDVNMDIEYRLQVRVKSKDNNWTQFSTTADGNYLYFINEDGVFSRANVITGDYETFDDIYIQSAGDLWSAAVSRDGNYVAFTSIYEDDNNIYLLISGELYYIPLDIPSTQEGISSSTIQYPDVLNWSPNAKYPKLAFDAYNQILLPSGQTRGWWSMGEIDFTGEELQVYSLLPAQPEGISVGNVQYSSTDPDRIAYSYIDDEADYWDINIVNFAEAGQDLFLQFPDRDVERPSFSPDDQMLVVDRFTDGKLLILDIASHQFSVLNLTTGARYPEWFVTGGIYDLEVAAEPTAQPAEFILESNFPNPFNAGTNISFTLLLNSRIHVAIYDLQGRLVRTLVDGFRAAGRHTINWQGKSTGGRPLASGIYFCRMEAENGFTATQKMVMVR
ncbi:M4 family metallopeptidase [candidate division KSB1 bacterium]|nr:M4 family metallopeptidase [candidate division KSB1 bacterium]